jgi:low affinity Fe/Cu permease
MSDRINRLFTRLGVLSAHPGAVLILLLYTLLWIIFQPHTLDWHGVATLCTWFMTLLIQRAEHRDTQAVHAKLDELLHIHGEARNELTRMDERQPEEIERFRSEHREQD